MNIELKAILDRYTHFTLTLEDAETELRTLLMPKVSEPIVLNIPVSDCTAVTYVGSEGQTVTSPWSDYWYRSPDPMSHGYVDITAELLASILQVTLESDYVHFIECTDDPIPEGATVKRSYLIDDGRTVRIELDGAEPRAYRPMLAVHTRPKIEMREYQPTCFVGKVGSLEVSNGQYPGLWDASFDGEDIKPHRKMEIVLEAGKPPVVKIEFLPTVKGTE